VCSSLLVRKEVTRRWINSEQKDNSRSPVSIINITEFSDRNFEGINAVEGSSYRREMTTGFLGIINTK
jgi:hypothetical protein